MHEDYRKILAHDVKVLEFWRKRYLLQAGLVVVIGGVLAGLVLMYVRDWRLWLILLPLIGVVLGVMLRELREGLQTKGESLIFAKGQSLFKDIRFDYGAGIDDKYPVWENWTYNLRDCRAVVRGEGFCVEEDCLFTLISSKFFEIRGTVFKGVILTIDCDDEAQNLLDDAKLNAEAENLRKILEADTVTIHFAWQKMCFCFVSKKRLYHQFSLLKFNALIKFVGRLEAVLAQIDVLRGLLKVDKAR